MDELKAWLADHSQSELAAALGITQGAVSQWVKRGKVPTERVFDIHAVTGIPPHRLRPDVFRGYADESVA